MRTLGIRKKPSEFNLYNSQARAEIEIVEHVQRRLCIGAYSTGFYVPQNLINNGALSQLMLSIRDQLAQCNKYVPVQSKGSKDSHQLGKFLVNSGIEGYPILMRSTKLSEAT